MATVAQALRKFHEAAAAMQAAAELVRTAVETKAKARTRDLRHPRVALVQEIVADHFGFTVERMLVRDKHEDFVVARMTAMALCREFTKVGLHRIALDFGGYHHGTVINADDSIRGRAQTDRFFAATFEEARAKVRAAIAAAQPTL